MSPIKSRKHAANRPVPTAIGLMLAALPGLAAAQTPPASPPAKPGEQTLPAVKATAARENEYKADTSASPKLTQPLVDTPQTITVIKKELLREQGATTLSEALRNTPGVTMLMGENGNTASGDSIFLRGFDTQNSIFVDGIRDIGAISRDIFNTEQVEVVKGPAGADIGRTAPSGYVNLISKVPFSEAYNTGSLTLGTTNRFRATADLNQPLDIGVAGTALRMNLMVQDYGVPGRDEVQKKSWGIAPSLAFGLNTPTRTYLYALYTKQNNRPDGGVSTYGVDGYHFSPALTPPEGVPADPVDSKNFYGSKKDDEDIEVGMFTARIEHDLAKGITLRNISRYGRSTQESLLTGVNAVTINGTVAGLTAVGTDPSTWLVARSRQGKYQENEIITNQTNLTAELGSGSMKHSVTTGLEFIEERQSTPAYAVVGTQVPANLYNPSTDDVFQPVARTGAFTKGSTTSVAVYAFDTLKIDDKWLINGGLRWEKYKTDFNSVTLATAAANPGLPVGTQIPLSLDTSDSLLSWKIGALFKPAPNGSVYVSAANSKQPPGGAGFALSTAANNANNPNLDPQEGSNVEIGTKWDFMGGRLAFAGALFRSENKNELVVDPLDPTVFNQIGKRRVQGIELSLVGQVTNELNLSLGLAKLDSKILEAAPATQGGTLQWTPELTFTSWLTYKFPFGLTLGGGARYVDNALSSSNVDTSTLTGVVEIPSYWVVDALVGYQVTKNVALQLNLYNLFDEKYMAAVNNGRTRYYPGVPRSALLSAYLQF